MVTGATGFVGQSVVRALLARGLKPICLVRSREKLLGQHPDVDPESWTAVVGSLNDANALREAVDLSQAAIHLVGIIIERRLRGQTFQRIHVKGTRAVIDAARRAGIKRFVHMSAQGTRENAATKYHRTKWEAEEYVRGSDLDWTVFRPSLIHGPNGEFMRLMRRFVAGWTVPVIPYFGDGTARIQPVSVRDVAECMVRSLFDEKTVGRVIPLGGPKTFSWVELYNACRKHIPGAKQWKPMVSQPVALAKVVATVNGPPLALAECVFPSLGIYRFDRGQVQMSQEDNVCDHTIAESIFGTRMRDFEEELSVYAGLID